MSIANPICAEANLLVRTSRDQIENAIALWAQVIFLYDSIGEQLSMLQNICNSLSKVHKDSVAQVEKEVNELDRNRHKLTESLELLKHTTVDPALGSKVSAGPEPGTSSDCTLRTFVYEDGIHQLNETADGAINAVKYVQNDLSNTIKALSRDIDEIRDSMALATRVQKNNLYQANQGSGSVADHAHTMAKLLESLARHYDQCTKAVEMMKVGDQQNDLEELLQVLENDAEEVQGVIQELQERSEEIKSSEKLVSGFHTQMKDVHSKMQSYFDDLDKFATRKLPAYLDKVDDQLHTQAESIAEVQKLVQEVGSLDEYYHLFYKSYHVLLLEIVRRNKAQAKMQEMITDMSRTLTNLYQEEVELRRTFVEQRGVYLPSDLWPGLSDAPPEPQITFRPATLPNISEASAQRARKINQDPK